MRTFGKGVQFAVAKLLHMKQAATSLVVGDSNHDIYRIDNARVMKMAHTIILQRTFQGVGLPFIRHRSHRRLYDSLSTLFSEVPSIGDISKIRVLAVG